MNDTNEALNLRALNNELLEIQQRFYSQNTPLVFDLMMESNSTGIFSESDLYLVIMCRIKSHDLTLRFDVNNNQDDIPARFEKIIQSLM